ITCSPPKILIPRRWPAESRPLREDPPAFLCAIAGLQTLLAYVLYRIGDKNVTALRHSRLLLFALGSWLFRGRGLFLLRGRGRLFGRTLVTFCCRGCFALRCLGPSWRPGVLIRLFAFSQNFGDPQERELLAVTALAARVLAPALLERNDLGAASLFKDLGRNGRARDGRSA